MTRLRCDGDKWGSPSHPRRNSEPARRCRWNRSRRAVKLTWRSVTNRRRTDAGRRGVSSKPELVRRNHANLFAFGLEVVVYVIHAIGPFARRQPECPRGCGHSDHRIVCEAGSTRCAAIRTRPPDGAVQDVRAVQLLRHVARSLVRTTRMEARRAPDHFHLCAVTTVE